MVVVSFNKVKKSDFWGAHKKPLLTIPRGEVSSGIREWMIDHTRLDKFSHFRIIDLTRQNLLDMKRDIPQLTEFLDNLFATTDFDTEYIEYYDS